MKVQTTEDQYLEIDLGDGKKVAGTIRPTAAVNVIVTAPVTELLDLEQERMDAVSVDVDTVHFLLAFQPKTALAVTLVLANLMAELMPEGVEGTWLAGDEPRPASRDWWRGVAMAEREAHRAARAALRARIVELESAATAAPPAEAVAEPEATVKESLRVPTYYVPDSCRPIPGLLNPATVKDVLAVGALETYHATSVAPVAAPFSPSKPDREGVWEYQYLPGQVGETLEIHQAGDALRFKRNGSWYTLQPGTFRRQGVVTLWRYIGPLPEGGEGEG